MPWLVSSPAKFNPTDADRNHPFAQATCLPEDAPTSLDWERGFHWGVLCALVTGLLVWALTWTCRRTCCRSKGAATSLEQPPRHLAGTATFATPKSPPALPPWVAPGPRQPIPSPPLPVETVLVTTTRGKAYHRRGCIHVRGHETRTFRPCLVCQPHVLLQEEDTRARLQAFNHDDAQRDTNHAIAHLAWWLIVLLVMGTSLGCFAFSSWVRPWRASRPARDPTYLKVGSLEKRVRFSLSPDSGSEAEREKAVVPESAAAQASLTTRHHRKRGRHPLVASQGSSPSAAKRAHPDNGPQAGVLPANAWARESLRLVRDHLSPTTQRLYDSHWRWWVRKSCSSTTWCTCLWGKALRPLRPKRGWELFVAFTYSWAFRTRSNHFRDSFSLWKGFAGEGDQSPSAGRSLQACWPGPTVLSLQTCGTEAFPARYSWASSFYSGSQKSWEAPTHGWG